MGEVRDVTILGIDPGYGRCGVAVLQRSNGKDALVFSDCIETSATDAFTERLTQVINACAVIIQEHHPHTIVLEKVFFSKNQKTAMQVAEVRGALIGLAGQSGLPIAEYTPGQIKNAVTGYGAADKKTIMKMVHILLPIQKKITHDDEYDAIAAGLTHLAHIRW